MTLDTWTQSNINDDYVAGSKPADGEIAIYASDAKELNKDYKSLVGKKITLKIPAKTAAGASVGSYKRIHCIWYFEKSSRPSKLF